MLTTKAISAAAVLLALVAPPSALADPITITSGTFTLSPYISSRDSYRSVSFTVSGGSLMLMLGPPSIRLEDEQRSPAVILLSWIIQNAESLGLKGFDLTIGDSDFKKRLGNQCVQLTMVELV